MRENEGMSRHQFKLRTLFVLLALCAWLCWCLMAVIDHWWMGAASDADLARLERGMTTTEVRAILGPPEHTSKWKNEETWSYGWGTFVCFKDGEYKYWFED